MGLDNYKTIITQARHTQIEDIDRTMYNPTLPIFSIINFGQNHAPLEHFIKLSLLLGHLLKISGMYFGQVSNDGKSGLHV